jgi:hypothetical protein
MLYHVWQTVASRLLVLGHQFTATQGKPPSKYEDCFVRFIGSGARVCSTNFPGDFVIVENVIFLEGRKYRDFIID